MSKNYVSNKNESARMFQNPILERLSHVHPLSIYVLYCPLLAYFGFLSLSSELTLATSVTMFLAGLLLWSLLEYVLHRFVFHLSPRTPLRKAVYFMIHGVHHDYPKDASRLVMPPAASFLAGLPFFFLYRALFGTPSFLPVFAGSLFGYLLYDTVHFAIHHFHPRTRLGFYLRQQHMRHHYLDPERNYGVTSPVWDVVFGTLLRSPGSGEREPDRTYALQQ